jgi:hypothetical protein
MSQAVEHAAARMRAIEARLPDGDGLRAFTRIYRVVTEQVRDALIRSDTFANPAFVERLDVVFADRFFAAEEAASPGRDVSPAWAPLAEARRRPAVLAVQRVLAGMNAHINHDLALAVVQTCSETGRSVQDPDVATDFQAVNTVLARVVRPIRQTFLTEAVVQAGAPASPAVDAISMWSIDKVRDAAWASAVTLWHVRALPPVAKVRARAAPDWPVRCLRLSRSGRSTASTAACSRHLDRGLRPGPCSTRG